MSILNFPFEIRISSVVWRLFGKKKNLRHTVDLNSGIPHTGKTNEKFMLNEMTQQKNFLGNK